MPRIYSLLKSNLLKWAPEPLLAYLKVSHYTRQLQSLCDSSEPDLAVVRKIVGPGDKVVDLGANIGLYTKVLSDLVGPHGRVISVEPVPQTFCILSRVVRSLGLENVECVNSAVSNRAGQLTMHLPVFDDGGLDYYDARVVSASDIGRDTSGRTVRVPAATLDALVADGDRISFVKCDVEGHELMCLNGATRVFVEHSPAWLIEISGDPDMGAGQASAVFRLMEGHRYSAWWFDGTVLRPRARGDRSTNYFFMTAKHTDALMLRAPNLVASKGRN